MVNRNEIHAMKLKLRENLFFELKIQFKNHTNYVVKFWRRGFDFLVWTGDPGTGIFSLTRGFETLIRDFSLMLFINLEMIFKVRM